MQQQLFFIIMQFLFLIIICVILIGLQSHDIWDNIVYFHFQWVFLIIPIQSIQWWSNTNLLRNHWFACCVNLSHLTPSIPGEYTLSFMIRPRRAIWWCRKYCHKLPTSSRNFIMLTGNFSEGWAACSGSCWLIIMPWTKSCKCALMMSLLSQHRQGQLWMYSNNRVKCSQSYNSLLHLVTNKSININCTHLQNKRA
jgi:hypothetical protein